MQQTARLEFSFSSDIARALEGALRPESLDNEGAGDTPKTRTRARIEGSTLVLDVWGEDISSLRAAVNANLRWIDAAEKAARLAL